MARSKPVYHEEILQLQFFFTCFKDSDEAADYVVHNSRQPGSFLLRPSTRTPGGLALTVRIDGSHARHVNVLQEHSDNSPTGRIYYVIRERCFNTFHDLYSYYSMNSITNMEHIENVRLLNPIERNREASNSVSSRSKPISISVTNKEIPPLPFRNPGGMSSSVKSGNADFSPISGADGGSHRTSSLDSEGNESRLSSSSIGSHVNEVPQLIRAPLPPKPNGSNLYFTDPFEDAPVSPTVMPTSQSNIPKSNSKKQEG
ncbi:hypothetical protein C0Q70_15438 [Pomacea canaliculata]|uniref:SH2 domain-containing protein n=1 Tax=Pomacea canaliculata TaxID=400727 RepID=A0A2T7NUW7_POMCA|nr:uncharacterized protein LOC112571822 [Pomacea canaliculata]PVD24944.1 hypothetical protein C0Q70_15438 [Pomacea canaliculata]